MEKAGAILNLGPRSVRNVDRKHASNVELKTPRLRSNRCPKIEAVDEMDRNLLRSIIMRYYSLNKAPFLKDVYHEFMEAVDRCDHVKEPLNFEDISTQSSTAVSSANDGIEIENSTPAVSASPLGPFAPPAAKLFSYATGLRVEEKGGRKAVTKKPGVKRFMSLSTFRKLVAEIGFVFGKINQRLAAVQRPDIVDRRGKYLRRLRQNENSLSPKPIIYTDETWADANARFVKAWVPKTITSYDEYQDFSYSKNKMGRAPRLIIIGAVSDKLGVITEVTKIYKVKKSESDGDFHQNIDRTVYLRWLNELLDHLGQVDPGQSYIIVIGKDTETLFRCRS
jgi:hypothetical protein